MISLNKDAKCKVVILLMLLMHHVPVVGDSGSNSTCCHHVHDFDGGACKTEKQVMSGTILCMIFNL
jgi:hypothetical protein